MTVLYVASALGLGGAAFEAKEAGRDRFAAEELMTLCALLAIAPAAVYEERRPRLVA